MIDCADGRIYCRAVQICRSSRAAVRAGFARDDRRVGEPGGFLKAMDGERDFFGGSRVWS